MMKMIIEEIETRCNRCGMKARWRRVLNLFFSGKYAEGSALICPHCGTIIDAVYIESYY